MTETPAAADDAVATVSRGFSAILSDSLGGILRLPRFDWRGRLMIVGLIVLAWGATAIYKVQPDEQGVVLRFGKWVATTEPGLHFHLPYPIETALFPKVTEINEIQLGAAPGAPTVAGGPAPDRELQMLNGDENIVEADCSVF
jgi:modulator of FtsH protease HflK